MTNPLIFSNAHMTSSRQSKNKLHAVRNKAQVYFSLYLNNPPRGLERDQWNLLVPIELQFLSFLLDWPQEVASVESLSGDHTWIE